MAPGVSDTTAGAPPVVSLMRSPADETRLRILARLTACPPSVPAALLTIAPHRQPSSVPVRPELMDLSSFAEDVLTATGAAPPRPPAALV